MTSYGPSHEPSLREEVRADELAPGRIRRALRAWLGALPASRDKVDDLVLAVDEAVANVVEHAYPGSSEGAVLVEAELRPADGDRGRPELVVVVVSDTGRWRPVPVDPGSRGRGLAMMKAFTECLSIKDTGDGTRVTLGCALA